MYTRCNAALLWLVHSKPLVSQDGQIWVKKQDIIQKTKTTFGHRDTAVIQKGDSKVREHKKTISNKGSIMKW